MALKKFVSSTVVAALAVTSMLPLSNAASAYDHYNRGGFHGRSNHHGEPQRGYGQRDNYGHQDNYGYQGYRRHRDHTGRNVALGVFAAILGLAIASEANQRDSRSHNYRGD